MPLAQWDDYLDLMRPAARQIEQSWAPQDERVRADLYRQLMMDLALGYMVYFQGDVDHPDFTPFLNSAFLLQPNPDDTYYYAPADGNGTYRLSGERGSVHLLTLNVGWRMIGMVEEPGPRLNEYNIGAMVPLDGPIDILLSAERPAGYDGLWLEMSRDADFLLVRQRSYRWGEERDARLAIQRLDVETLKAPFDPERTDAALRKAIGFAERLTRQWLGYLNRIKAQYPPNDFHFTGFAEFGGVAAQVYWEAIFELGEDEALILETALPERHFYWNVQLNDTIWNTVEYVWRQSSLNGAQARLDDDGTFRAVIAASDPGVPNWLDTNGYRTGTMVGRWYDCSDHPQPSLKRVKLDELRRHLPAETPTVTAAERRASLLQRSRGAQLRRRW